MLLSAWESPRGSCHSSLNWEGISLLHQNESLSLVSPKGNTLALYEGSLPKSQISFCLFRPSVVPCSSLQPCPWDFFQWRILEWVVIPPPRGPSQPRDRARVSCVSPCIAGRFFHCWAIAKYPCQSFRDCIWVRRARDKPWSQGVKPLAQPSSSLILHEKPDFPRSNSLTLPPINLSSTQCPSLISPILPHTSSVPLSHTVLTTEKV